MLQNAIRNVFLQLIASLEPLDGRQYTQECPALSNVSIGKHLRHVIGLFQCLEKGYTVGVVNYEKRQRDTRIEDDKDLALSLLHEIRNNLDKPDKELILESSYDEDSSELISIRTNYHRELIYNLEHSIHHMALIRVGINEVSQIQLPGNYGVASSTIKQQQSCAP
ncbi:MAG: DinB family protein [Chitinophagaceae bacterium]|nr:DinB family protein [Chitinophagaceae bacterium]